MSWFVLYFIVLVITISFHSYFSANALDVFETFRKTFLAINLVASTLLIFIFYGFFVNASIRERAKANRLLLNVLSAEIEDAQKESDKTIAEHHESVSVLFADVVELIPLFVDHEPTEVVDWLN
ncbi:MAG: hypothetical protein HN495_04330 [Chloroflexi bacterium]|nr:hypothetical protein [Chloroflexota bacterium]